MTSEYSLIVELSGKDSPDDATSAAKERLIREINDLGPIAKPVSAHGAPGTKGDVVTLGQIALAFFSSGVAVKAVAGVMTEFIKRNPKYMIKVGDITISKDHASEREIEMINAQVMKMQKQDSKK